MTYELDIPNLSCGHCVSAVSKAIATADPDAVASIDLKTRKVAVESKADPVAIRAALEQAGYPPS